MNIRLGRALCSELSVSERREWLVTNGLGGYASGTVAGLLTRRYHGLLVAATDPPVGRSLLVPKVEERAVYAAASFNLAVNRWADGTIDPRGHAHIESFRLEGSAPVWRYACADALIEKRIWMPHGFNVSCLRYDVVRATGEMELSIRVFIDGRDHHGITRAGARPSAPEPLADGFRCQAWPGAPQLSVRCAGMSWALEGAWWYGFDLARERERGLEDREDHWCAGRGTIGMSSGSQCTIVLALADADVGQIRSASWESFVERERALVSGWRTKAEPQAARAPAWIEQLVIAADQFIVARGNGDTIIAGYPWFTDWGRDTMISLFGLSIATGRSASARNVLETFARFVDQGMIPNRFPDAGPPEYNTVDATLWFVIAIDRYVTATRDSSFAARCFPMVADIIDWYVRGTRHGIARDEGDGLLRCGEAGAQLTWMDAKVGDRVITPRIGKPVEVNALWVNALTAAGRLASFAGAPRRRFDDLAVQARTSFARFWNEASGYCFDVLDGPEGDDRTCRPNQLIAIALPDPLLGRPQMAQVVDACARELLVSYGVRTLSPEDHSYRGSYQGDPSARDGAYHQGTAWCWLLGIFALAHYRAYGDRSAALRYLEPLEDALTGYSLGSLGELFDGDAPHAPKGCIAQAWSVAVALEAWTELSSQVDDERS